MRAHELDQALGVYIGSELAGVGTATILGGVDVGVVIAFVARRVAGLKAGPHRPVIKAVLLQSVWLDPEVIDLPLAGGAGGIAELFHQAGKGDVFFLFPVEISDSPARNIPMADPPRAAWVFTRQKRRARWRAGPH